MGRIQVGATGASAHGGASPPVNSAGSGCHLGPRAQVSPGRRLWNFMLFLCHFPTFKRSPSQSPHPLLVFRLRFSFHVSILASPRVSPPLLPCVSLGFLPLRFLRFSPLRSPLCDPGLFSSPYAHVSLQLLSRSPLRFLQFVRFIRRDLRVHIRSSLSPRSFRFSVLPPRFRGSVFVARESRRSALTPLPRSSKGHRVMGGS